MIHSFLLIGQSNMAGRGFLDEAKEIDTSHIYTLRMGRWARMFRPINPDRSFSGVNLAERFAELYAKKYGVDVGLICCADGGTKLKQWECGDVLFEHAVYQARLAMKTSEIQGILWHQGEGDCAKEFYSTYETRFTDFVNALRKELNLPDVPFLVGGLGDFLKDCTLSEHIKNYTFVNDALKNVALNNPNMGFVSAEGLGANPDNLHFNAKALYEFGERYFEEFEKIANVTIEKQETNDYLERTEMEKL